MLTYSSGQKIPMNWRTTSSDPLRQALEVRKTVVSAPLIEDPNEAHFITISANVSFELPFDCLEGETVQGSLECVYLTNYRLHCGHADLPISVIRSVSLSSRTISIYTSEIRHISVSFSSSDAETVRKFVDVLSLFAFSTRDVPFALSHRGQIGNFFDENFARLEFPGCRVSTVNGNFSQCATYPEKLIVPSGISDSEIRACAEFRDKMRFPVCSFPGLWRSAQPKTPLGNRSQADENFLAALGERVLIMDLRPMINALANQLIQGSGSENVANYPNVDELVFCDIPNIHVVRDAFDAIFAEIGNFSFRDCTYGWWPIFERAGWYAMIGKIFKAASLAQNSLQAGRAVLVHCSDGWDRTPQVTSLVMLLEDSHFRTFEGFAALVDQEWVRLGHKLHDRLGFGSPDSREFSPVLMQWLDCVHQALRQRPDAFEFDEKFLVRFYELVISARYGNFVFNNEQERHDRGVYSKCRSLWPDLFRQSRRRVVTETGRINIEYRAFGLCVWNSFWLRFTKLS